MSRLDDALRDAYDLGRKLTGRGRIVSEYFRPEIAELMGLQAREWPLRHRRLRSSGVPMAANGFTSPVLPNTEPVTRLGPVGGTTSELNLFTPGTGTNADWALIPQGSLKAPQAWRVFAAGQFYTTASSNTISLNHRIGTGAPAANAVIGSTGVMTMLPAAGTAGSINGGPWFLEGHFTVRQAGPAGIIDGALNVDFGNAIFPTNTFTSLAAGSNAVDCTIQQGYVISTVTNVASFTLSLDQFMLASWD